MFKDKDGELSVAKIGVWAFIGFVALIIVLSGFAPIDAGYRGVKTRFGNVVGVLEPGLNFKMPIFESVTAMDVQIQKEQKDTQAASADLQTVTTSIAVNFNLEPEAVGDLFAKIGPDYNNRIIDPAIQESVKATTAKYTAEELITKREAVRDEIKSLLTNKLSPENITVTEVSIVNFDFSKSFNDAIEAKVTAQQNALAAQNKLQQVQFEAEQRVAQAKGEAEAIKIQAEAITQQGGAAYVQLQGIKQWDGKLPVSLYGSAPLPFVSGVK